MAQSSAEAAAPAVAEAEAFLRVHADDACDETFFQCGAVDLAVSLIGQYLYFHDSKIAVRILETEAYPADDEVYGYKFYDRAVNIKALLKLRGGTLVAWSPSHYTTDYPDIYISAGPVDNGDLVLIRSCEPILGLDEILIRRKNPRTASIRKNLLIGPTNVSEGVGTEWQNDPILYRPGGVQLFCAVSDLATEKVKRGKRILSRATAHYGCEGTDSPFRFALTTPANYSYSSKCDGLHKWEI